MRWRRTVAQSSRAPPVAVARTGRRERDPARRGADRRRECRCGDVVHLDHLLPPALHQRLRATDAVADGQRTSRRRAMTCLNARGLPVSSRPALATQPGNISGANRRERYDVVARALLAGAPVAQWIASGFGVRSSCALARSVGPSQPRLTTRSDSNPTTPVRRLREHATCLRRAGPQEREHGEHAAMIVGRLFEAQFHEDLPHVRLHRLRAQGERRPDRRVRAPFRHQ